MPEKITLGEDQGFMTVEIDGNEATFDVIAVFGELVEINRQCGTDVKKDYELTLELMQRLGYPPNMSRHMAEQFAEVIIARCIKLRMLKKNGAGGPETEPTTTSTTNTSEISLVSPSPKPDSADSTAANPSS